MNYNMNQINKKKLKNLKFKGVEMFKIFFTHFYTFWFFIKTINRQINRSDWANWTEWAKIRLVQSGGYGDWVCLINFKHSSLRT